MRLDLVSRRQSRLVRSGGHPVFPEKRRGALRLVPDERDLARDGG